MSASRLDNDGLAVIRQVVKANAPWLRVVIASAESTGAALADLAAVLVVGRDSSPWSLPLMRRCCDHAFMVIGNASTTVACLRREDLLAAVVWSGRRAADAAEGMSNCMRGSPEPVRAVPCLIITEEGVSAFVPIVLEEEASVPAGAPS